MLASSVSIRRARLVGPVARLVCGSGCCRSDWAAIARVHHDAFESAHRQILGKNATPWFVTADQLLLDFCTAVLVFPAD